MAPSAMSGRHAAILAACLVLTGNAAVAAPGGNAAITEDARRLVEWIAISGDNAGQAFVIVDKRKALVFAHDRDGRLLGAAPALLGLARGDTNPAGIGDKPLSAIRPDERVTAAGRFVATIGRDLGKNDILWVDYAAGLSLHRVIPGKPAEQRLRRLATETPDDNRISYGCINVPVAFFDGVVRPLFVGTTGIVYVLPESRPMSDIFPAAAAR